MPGSASSPAVRSYFFGKGYRDLGATITDAWKRNLKSAGDFFDRGAATTGEEMPYALVAALWFAAGAAVFVFGTATIVLLSAIHVVLLSIVFGSIYVGFSIVLLIERTVMVVRGFVSVCPVCHSRLALPVYRCDSCGAEHPRLIPSSYGILWHRCRCGQRLPCTLLLDRGRLRSNCPECSHSLAREHTETRKQFVPIVGGPSVGKSAFLFSACRILRDRSAPAKGMTASLVDAGQERAYERAVRDLDAGRPPDKTVETLPKAFDLLFRGGGRADETVYLYDPAGDAFLNSDELVPHKFLEYLSGIVFLVDPFSIPELRNRYASRLHGNAAEIRPSSLPIEDVMTRLLNTMEAQYGHGSRRKIGIPLAIVINKVDTFDLEDLVGERALSGVPLKSGETEVERRNRLVRDRLREWGEAPFVQQVETRFSMIRYFTVSALGRTPDRSAAAFTPIRVSEPVHWILGRRNPIWGTGPQRGWWHLVSAGILVLLTVAVTVAVMMPSSRQEPIVRPTAISSTSGAGQPGDVLPATPPSSVPNPPRGSEVPQPVGFPGTISVRPEGSGFKPSATDKPAPTAPLHDATPRDPYAAGQRLRVKEGINLRREPMVKSNNIIGGLYKDSVVTSLGRRNGRWLEVDDVVIGRGWASTTFLEHAQ